MERKFDLKNFDTDTAMCPAVYLTDPAVLQNQDGLYGDRTRRFQGIPGIERTKNGRLYFVFYTGADTEEAGNYLLLLTADENMQTPAKAQMAVLPPHESVRCFDPCLWMDPDGQLWLFWGQSLDKIDGRLGVWCACCADPDADVPVFSAPRRIANGVMMNKPTVTKSGRWLLPCAIWNFPVTPYYTLPEEEYSNVYASDDKGKTFTLLGYAEYPLRCIDEHMTVQRQDGSLWMLIRSKGNLGQAFSYDDGRTWEGESDSGIPNPGSRFHIRRLKSGRLLMVNHVQFSGRNNLTAQLSEDDGKTWSPGLLLDERGDVSYPDAVEGDGKLYIIYDYNRYHDKEILMASVTEEDILAGRLLSDGSALRILVNKAYGTKEG